MCGSDASYKVISLSKKFPSIHQSPVIEKFEDSIFKVRYFTHCMSHGNCMDICCSYGVDVDAENAAKIMNMADELERFTKTSRNEWFSDEGVTDPEFPGGRYTRTKVKNGLCVFKNPEGRGCMIHSFCLEKGLDYHQLKPMVSTLFPITFDEGLLHPSDETMDRTLACLDQGLTIYRGVRDELRYYFGEELVAELDSYERELSA